MRTLSAVCPLLATLLALTVTTACSREAEDNAPPVASVTVTASPSAAPIGSPVEMRYRFVVRPDAPALPEGYWVFVHVADPGGEQLWTDDHQPPTPTSQWKPGATIEYTRTMFVPKVAYAGETRIDAGLYSPASGDRVPLAGEVVGNRAYRVGRLEVQPASEGALVSFTEGWHDPESPLDATGLEWRWSKTSGVLTFRNPKRDAELLLDFDQPIPGVVPPQQVEVRLANELIDSFPVEPGPRRLRRVPLPAARMGAGDVITVTLTVDRTVNPAAFPAARSSDVRALGVRVFHAHVQAK